MKATEQYVVWLHKGHQFVVRLHAWMAARLFIGITFFGYGAVWQVPVDKIGRDSLSKSRTGRGTEHCIPDCPGTSCPLETLVGGLLDLWGMALSQKFNLNNHGKKFYASLYF